MKSQNNQWVIVLPNPDDKLREWVQNQAKNNRRAIGAEVQVILEKLSSL